MPSLWLSILGLTVLTLLVMLWPLFVGRPRFAGATQADANIAIYRGERDQIELDFREGRIDSAERDRAIAEIEARIVDDVAKVNVPVDDALVGRRRWVAPAFLALLVPVVAVGIYGHLGNPNGPPPEAALVSAAEHGDGKAVEQLARSLAERLRQNPENLEGWVVLARTYYVTGRHRDAAAAFEQAVALAPNDAELLTDYADALGVAQGQSLDGKPAELIERALRADPGHWKANALAGTIAFRHKEYAKAAEFWERTRAALPAGSDMGRSIEGSIAEARQLGGLGPAAGAAVIPGAGATGAQASSSSPTGRESSGAPKRDANTGTPPAATSPGAGGAKIAGTVRLAPALQKTVSPDDAVFVYARPADGSRMPLALYRAQVKDLPIRFALDDTMAMSPTAKISDHAEVLVGARVARSGSPMPRSGDLEAAPLPAKTGASGVELLIDKTIP